MKMKRLWSIDIGKTVMWFNFKMKLLEKRSDGRCVVGILSPVNWTGASRLEGVFDYTETNWRGRIAVFNRWDIVTPLQKICK